MVNPLCRAAPCPLVGDDQWCSDGRAAAHRTSAPARRRRQIRRLQASDESEVNNYTRLRRGRGERRALGATPERALLAADREPHLHGAAERAPSETSGVAGRGADISVALEVRCRAQHEQGTLTLAAHASLRTHPASRGSHPSWVISHTPLRWPPCPYAG